MRVRDTDHFTSLDRGTVRSAGIVQIADRGPNLIIDSMFGATSWSACPTSSRGLRTSVARGAGRCGPFGVLTEDAPNTVVDVFSALIADYPKVNDRNIHAPPTARRTTKSKFTGSASAAGPIC